MKRKKLGAEVASTTAVEENTEEDTISVPKKILFKCVFCSLQLLIFEATGHFGNEYILRAVDAGG